MIKEAESFLEVLQIVPHEVESREKHPHPTAVPIKDYLMVLDCIMNKKQLLLKKDMKIWMSYSDEGELNGYLIAMLTLTKIKSLNEVRLIKAWYDSKENPDVMRELHDKAVEWAKEYGIKTLKCEADWNDKLIEAMENNWAFSKCTAIMSRRI